MLLLLVTALAVVVVPRLRRGGPHADAASGTVLVTGVSPRPDADGEQYVTIAGVLTGPTVREHTVYQRMVVNVQEWPTIGQLLPVVYSLKNPDNWSVASPPADSWPGSGPPLG